MRKDLREVEEEEQVKWLSEGRTFQAEKMPYAKTLRCLRCPRNSRKTNSSGVFGGHVVANESREGTGISLLILQQFMDHYKDSGLL